MERERSTSPYKEFKPGDRLDFNLQTLLPDGSIRVVPKTIVIEAVKGGGFFGKVLIPKDEPFVIKTSLPDPLHHTARITYWGFRDFPSQTDETAAQLDHIATKIVHLALPTLTDGRFYAPYSLGYTKLSTGYAQVVEKIDGRPPRYDLETDEYKAFRGAQKELTRIGLELGLEQVGQIHPDNPLGMSNLWFDPRNQVFVWLDTLPAIPHKGPFKFHREIGNKFPDSKPTFNKIHTDNFMQLLRRSRYLFSYDVFKEIEGYTLLYEKLSSDLKSPQRNMEAYFDASDELMDEALKKVPEVAKRALLAFAVSPIRILFDSKYRDRVILSGVKEAKEQGIITGQEFAKAKEAIETYEHTFKRKAIHLGLFPLYWLIGRGTNALEIYIFVDSNDILSGILKVGLIELLLPPIARRAATLGLSKLSKEDLRVAAALTVVPFMGYPAAIAQIAASPAANSEPARHYKLREIIASFTAYGSQLEGLAWKHVGSKLERLEKILKTANNSFY